MAATAALGRKIVSISSKRQITIPQKFFHALRFDSEAECILKNGELVLRPSRPAPAEDFSEEILAELVAQGLSGEKLLAAFREKRAKVRTAVQTMRNDAAKAAKGEGKYATMADVFEKR